MFIELLLFLSLIHSLIGNIVIVEDRFDINFEDDVIGNLIRFRSRFFDTTFLWTVSIAFATVILLIPTIRDTWRRFHSLP